MINFIDIHCDNLFIMYSADVHVCMYSYTFTLYAPCITM